MAHTTFRGLGEFGSGFLHPLTTPVHILVILGVGLMLGQHLPLRLGRALAAFAVFAAIGLLATRFIPVYGLPSPVLIGVGLGASILVVSGWPPSFFVRILVCALAGMALGLDSGVDPGTSKLAAAKILFATWASLALCVVNVAFYVSLLPPHQWIRTGVRVAGSWIVAVALLMLAFALRR